MGPLNGPMVLLFGLLISGALAVQDHQPMVAFMCNKSAMHNTEKGWVADPDTDCLPSAGAILDYCKKMYPTLDITNVVEADAPVTIKKWCKKGKDHCKHHHTHMVTPFRCLVGAFQSDALLVPKHCVFDHVHDKRKCGKVREWHKVAIEACHQRKKEVQSTGMLLPCGTDVFTGVEYVCCPIKGMDKKVAVPPGTIKSNVHVTKPKVDHKKAKKVGGKPKSKKNKKTFDSFSKYMHAGLKSKYGSEHKKFKEAIHKWEENQHAKITNVMKQWSQALAHITEMKDTDPKGAARMHKEVTERFQKTYKALEVEGQDEKVQLTSMHQQHIVVNLNDRKRKAMELLTDALNEKKPVPELVKKHLERYIRVEQKDREHTMNHFKHVRNNQPDEADRIRKLTINHLQQIDERINQSLQLVNRLPDKKMGDKIKDDVLSWMGKYYDNIVIPVTNEEILKKYKQTVAKHVMDKVELPPKPKKIIDDQPKKKEMTGTNEIKPIIDDETYEDEHLYVEMMQPQHVGHAKKDTIALQENELLVSKGSVHKVVNSSTSTIGIAVGATVAFFIIVVAIVVIRRKQQSTPENNGFVEVSQAVSPEERHVMSMQSSGYENPTYKFFEMQA